MKKLYLVFWLLAFGLILPGVCLPTDKTVGELASTEIEWGIVIKGEINVKGKPEISDSPEKTGLVLLRGIKIEGHQLTIKVDSGGCTDKGTIEVKISKGKSPLKGYKHYHLSFVRKLPDRCKALHREEAEITYDLIEELKLSPPFTISIENPLTLSTKLERQGKDKTDQELSLKVELLEATKRALQEEIKRYESKIPPERDKAEALRRKLEELNNMRIEEYPLEPVKPTPPAKPGIVMPPIAMEVEIASLPKVGEILHLSKQSKSGPFFHVAGVSKEATPSLGPEPKPPFKAKVYLVYKREYILNIEDYYVYIERVEKSSSESKKAH